jgi:hypothetical protein
MENEYDFIKSLQLLDLKERHTRLAKDGGRIEMYWFSLVYEDLNDLYDHGCLLRYGQLIVKDSGP